MAAGFWRRAPTAEADGVLNMLLFPIETRSRVGCFFALIDVVRDNGLDGSNVLGMFFVEDAAPLESFIAAFGCFLLLDF